MACDNDPMPQSFEYDVLIIGSGAAGLTVALNLPEHLKVCVVSKAQISSGATLWRKEGSLRFWMIRTPPKTTLLTP